MALILNGQLVLSPREAAERNLRLLDDLEQRAERDGGYSQDDARMARRLVEATEALLGDDR